MSNRGENPFFNENIESKEQLKPPYFIREATLGKTLERLKEIDKSKRRIIIYAGVHPNEGTDILSEKFASVWAEKYGATVVCQPTEETPHAIWAKHGRDTGGDASVPLPADTVLNEEDYAHKFSLEDDSTFVIRFHGTPLSFAQSRKNPGLGIITSRYYKNPHEFKDRPRASLFNNLAITEGLKAVFVHSEDGVANYVVEEEGEPEFNEVMPNMLLVEYFYKDKPVEVIDPYILELQKRETAEGVFPLSMENWQRQLKIGLEYIGQPAPSAEGVTDFDNFVVKDFEKILKHISDRLPSVE